MSEGAKQLPTAVDSEITGFDSSKLKHTECHEKTSLPSPEGIIHIARHIFIVALRLSDGICM